MGGGKGPKGRRGDGSTGTESTATGIKDDRSTEFFRSLLVTMAHTSPQLPRTILDYWRIILQYRTMIFGLFLGSVLITGVVSMFLLTRLYEAKTSVLPAREEPLGGGLSFGGGEKGKGGSAGVAMMLEAVGGSTKSGPTVMEILHAILISRKMAEAVITQLNLLAYYETDSLTKAITFLRDETDIRRTKDKIYEVIVLSRDPRMAADIANAYGTNLDRFNKELTITSTKRHRVFIEQRVAEKTQALQQAEHALKEFQTKHRILAVSEQAEAAIGTVANLHAQLVSLEVELAALREYATPSHPSIKQLEAQIEEVRRQLDTLEQGPHGAGSNRARMSKKAFPDFAEAPTLAMELLRLTRQVKVEESIYGMLVGMREQARIAEARDIPTIQILDQAVPPEFKSWPKNLQNVLVAAALSFILGIMLAFFLNYVAWLKAQEVAASPGLVAEAVELVTGSPALANGNGEGVVEPASAPKETEQFHV